MSIEDLKRWQWALIGGALGLAVACVQVAVGPEALVAGSRSYRISQDQFERDLLSRNARGRPIESGITVYPASGSADLVRLARLEPPPPGSPKGAQWTERPAIFMAPRPYGPLDPALQAKVTFDPARDDTRGVELAGWQRAPRQLSADPGGGAGAEARFRLLSGADYDLRVSIAPPATAGQLKGSFNGRPLAPFRLENSRRGVWRTTVPAAAVRADGAPQVLTLARRDAPVPVLHVEVADPTYTVLDYLAEVRQSDPRFAYRYAWWAEDKIALVLWPVVGLVLVGGIWPALVRLLSGIGQYHRPVPGKSYDLSRFGAGQRRPKVGAPTALGTKNVALAEVTSTMVAELQKSAAAEAAEATARGAAPPAAPAPVRHLDAGPAAPAPPPESDAPKEYGGEFYPVAREQESKHETQSTKSETNSKVQMKK